MAKKKTKKKPPPRAGTRPAKAPAKSKAKRATKKPAAALGGSQSRSRPKVANRNKRPEFDGVWVVDRKNVSGLTVQRQWVKCGKARCRCMKGGAPHGPYWFAYKTNRAGRQLSKYIGIELDRAKVAAWA